MMKQSKYSRMLPPPTAQSLESLRASIRQRGVDEPIIVDENGEIIDGWHRYIISVELGIFCPRQVRKFTSEAEKYELALTLNLARRQLNRKQRRDLITTYLKADPVISDNLLATIVGGMASHHVASVRAKLVAENEIPHIEKLRGHDGKFRPTKYTKIVVNSPIEFEKAKKAIENLPLSGKIMDVITATRLAAKHKNKIAREEKTIFPLSEGDIRLYHCHFQDIPRLAGIDDGSAQLALTDIPYGQEFLPQIEDLGRLAQQILAEGGLLVTHCGQYWMNKVIEGLSRHLTYRWTMCSVWNGDATPVHIGGWKESHARVLSKWKPILVFSKGSFPHRGQWCDVSHVNEKEKDWHPWQLPLAEVEMLVRYFSEPGDLVVDPCGGGFTTAVACRNLGRRCISCDVDEACVQRGLERLAVTPYPPSDGTIQESA